MRTTQERISDLIEMEFEFYPSKTEGRCEVRCDENGNKAHIEYCAKKIAAEIDALQARNAFLLTSAETAQAKLAECREIAKKYEDRFFAAASQVAGALAEVERLTPAAKAMWAYVKYLRVPIGSPDEAALATEWLKAFDFVAKKAEGTG